MAAYTAANNDKVRKLVFVRAAMVAKHAQPDRWRGSARRLSHGNEGERQKRWLNGVPEDKQADLIPAGWFDAWADATWETDPKSKDSGALRAPNGVVQDVRDYWASGKPYYDPADIRVPTL